MRRASSTDMIVADIMTRHPTTADVTDSVSDVAKTLQELDVRHLPIVNDEEELVGIITDRDLRGIVPPPEEIFERPAEAARLLERPIGEFMSSSVLSVDPESDLGEAIDLMLESRVGAIPVVAPDTQGLVGIVSYVDVLRAARSLL